MNSEKTIYIYGLGEAYRVIRYGKIALADLSIGELLSCATSMVKSNPSIKQVYAVDNGYTIYEAYFDSINTNSIEDRVIFKILLEQKGLRLF